MVVFCFSQFTAVLQMLSDYFKMTPRGGSVWRFFHSILITDPGLGESSRSLWPLSAVPIAPLGGGTPAPAGCGFLPGRHQRGPEARQRWWHSGRRPVAAPAMLIGPGAAGEALPVSPKPADGGREGVQISWWSSPQLRHTLEKKGN